MHTINMVLNQNELPTLFLGWYLSTNEKRLMPVELADRLSSECGNCAHIAHVFNHPTYGTFGQKPHMVLELDGPTSNRDWRQYDDFLQTHNHFVFKLWQKGSKCQRDEQQQSLISRAKILSDFLFQEALRNKYKQTHLPGCPVCNRYSMTYSKNDVQPKFRCEECGYKLSGELYT